MYKPYPYQQDLIDKARNSLKHGHHAVLIVSPPGSGKSIIIGEIVRLALIKGGHVLFMVHRKELIAQIKETLCKDEVNLSQVTIMTPVKIKNRLGTFPTPTLIMTDEAHHSLAKSYVEIYKYFKNVPRVGFTATPWRMSHQGLGHRVKELGRVYDDIVEGQTVKWLINHHYLAPYTLYGFKNLDRKHLKVSNGDYTKSSMDKFLQDNERVIHGSIVKNWKKYANNRRTIIYCHSVEFSKQIASWFNEQGIKAAEADSKTPQKERDEIMEDFRNGNVKILCNVDLVSEGFNVPDCGCVVLLRPTRSLVVYLQQSMRCMRYKPNKKAVIIDQVGNFDYFGLPDQQHEWTLHSRPKKEHLKAVMQCTRCQATFYPDDQPIFESNEGRYITCPSCGLEIPLPKNNGDRKDPKLQEDDQLEAINQFQFTTNYIALQNPKNIKTKCGLEKFAQAKGYKPGWVYYYIKNHPYINYK